MEKHILFYSNLCNFSQETIQTIYKKNLRDRFMNVCIENPKFQNSLPPFVDRVPMILTANQEIVVDHNGQNNIDMFINMLSSVSSGQSQQQPSSASEKEDADLTPFSALEMGSKLSDGFSYISDEQDQFGWSHNFVRIGGEQQMINPSTDTATTEKNKMKEAMYENYIQERNRFDETHYKARMG